MPAGSGARSVLGDPDQARLRRLGGQGVQPVVACGARRAHQRAARLDQLGVERLSGEVGADHEQVEPRIGEPFGQDGQSAVGVGRAGEHHAERQAVHEPGGDGERGVVQEVGEVGEAPHPGVGADRVGRHLGEGGVPGGGRGEQRHAAVESRTCGGAERGEPGGVGGPVGSGLLLAGQHDGGDGGVEVGTDQVVVLLDVPAHGGVPFGHERAAVQQLGGLQQRGDIGLDDLHSGVRQAGDRGVEGLAPAVGHVFQVRFVRYGDPGARGRRRQLGAGAGERVGRVGALDDLRGCAGES